MPVVFGATVYVTCPFAVPEAVPVKVMKFGLFETAFQLHEDVPVTVTVSVPETPPTGAVRLVGLTDTEHAALWLTVNVSVPTVIVADREVVAEFAAAEKLTEPLPAPLVGDVIVSQSVPPLAVQAHCALLVVNEKDPVPPVEATVALVGALAVNEHVPAAWLTVKPMPATVIVPVRGEVDVFGVTVYPADPEPVPGLPNEMVIQLTLDAALRDVEQPEGSAPI